MQGLCEPQDTYSGTKIHRPLEYLTNLTGLTYFARFDQSLIQKEESAERNSFLCAEMACIKTRAHPMLLNIILTVSLIHAIKATKRLQQQYSSALHLQDFHKRLILLIPKPKTNFIAVGQRGSVTCLESEKKNSSYSWNISTENQNLHRRKRRSGNVKYIQKKHLEILVSYFGNLNHPK